MKRSYVVPKYKDVIKKHVDILGKLRLSPLRIAEMTNINIKELDEVLRDEYAYGVGTSSTKIDKDGNIRTDYIKHEAVYK